ncbi:MAG: NusG domain II-containing protein [Ruminococcaceae bacterium]|jgi:hypothetical protein|nr:NusG domain II-containing protein [Oscillospiraceae bacterium]
MADQVSLGSIKQNRQPWYRLLKWGDWLAYGLIGCLAIVLLAFAPGRQDRGAVQAVLTREGETILTVTAEQMKAGGSAEIEAEGYHYLVEYADNRIRFAEADCPDRICVRSGWISRPGQIAACVPGQLILRVEATGAGPTDPDDVDVIIG